MKIVLIAIAAFMRLYFASGPIAVFAVEKAIFSHRGNDPENLPYRYYLRKIRDDYQELLKRDVHHFKSGENALCGYYYDVPNEKGLIITVHGLGGCADDDNAQYQSFFVREGFDLFSFDLTGTGNSEGDGLISLWQSAIDVTSAYSYLSENNLLKEKVFLVGYSYGAYGVSLSLDMGVKANGVIAFSGFDRPVSMMKEKAKQYAGTITSLTIPAFHFGEVLLHGLDPYRAASEVILKTKTKALLIQGKEDKTVTLPISLYKSMEGKEGYKTILLEEATHTTPWCSKKANAYYSRVLLPSFEKRFGNREISKKELLEFRSSIDLEKSSELNQELFQEISSFLEQG